MAFSVDANVDMVRRLDAEKMNEIVKEMPKDLMKVVTDIVATVDKEGRGPNGKLDMASTVNVRDSVQVRRTASRIRMIIGSSVEPTIAASWQVSEILGLFENFSDAIKIIQRRLIFPEMRDFMEPLRKAQKINDEALNKMRAHFKNMKKIKSKTVQKECHTCAGILAKQEKAFFEKNASQIKLEELKKELESIESENGALVGSIQNLQANCQGLEETKRMFRQKTLEAQEAQRRCEEIKNARASRDMEHLINEKEKLESEAARQEKMIQQNEEQIKINRQKLSELEAENQLGENVTARLEQQYEEVANENAKTKAGIDELVSALEHQKNVEKKQKEQEARTMKELQMKMLPSTKFSPFNMQPTPEYYKQYVESDIQTFNLPTNNLREVQMKETIPKATYTCLNPSDPWSQLRSFLDVRHNVNQERNQGITANVYSLPQVREHQLRVENELTNRDLRRSILQNPHMNQSTSSTAFNLHNSVENQPRASINLDFERSVIQNLHIKQSVTANVYNPQQVREYQHHGDNQFENRSLQRSTEQSLHTNQSTRSTAFHVPNSMESVPRVEKDAYNFNLIENPYMKQPSSAAPYNNNDLMKYLENGLNDLNLHNTIMKEGKQANTTYIQQNTNQYQPHVENGLSNFDLESIKANASLSTMKSTQTKMPLFPMLSNLYDCPGCGKNVVKHDRDSLCADCEISG
ncbi:hypothetical protein B9Z55_025016 [Caenorhabditis nigoni]|uniref:Uncharacterized protein n=1 Tax=Caenorhabditis nigoni TaxID=1611254 RepID=A0A2G5SWG2_9PELO|nr:hypothetical protein B9Z55_025016 [Caenorhabditis nigoni]